MTADKMQTQRYELKYHITDDLVSRIRDFIGSYLELDEYSQIRNEHSYPVHSLYLDSPDLKLYMDTINGTKNRFKLRLRFYDENPETPVFFEIKRRINDIIRKERGGIRREYVADILNGAYPDETCLIKPTPEALVAVQRFCTLMHELRARPKGHVAYMREAWENPNDNSVRVTFDKLVKFEPEFGTDLSTAMRSPIFTFGKETILELKFTNKFPIWFLELVRTFNLQRSGAAKYADGVTTWGVEKLIMESQMVPISVKNSRSFIDFKLGDQ
jgi:hypothetical protein